MFSIPEVFNPNVDTFTYNVTVNGQWIGHWETYRGRDAPNFRYYPVNQYATFEQAMHIAMAVHRDRPDSRIDIILSYGSFPVQRATVYTIE